MLLLLLMIAIADAFAAVIVVAVLLLFVYPSISLRSPQNLCTISAPVSGLFSAINRRPDPQTCSYKYAHHQIIIHPLLEQICKRLASHGDHIFPCRASVRDEIISNISADGAASP